MRGVSQTYRFGDFTLETGEHTLRREGREVFLRPKAFETLLYLVDRHGHLVKKDELVEGVWAGTSVSDAVLTHCVAEVRQALDDDVRSPRFLKTIPRVGYKFIGEVREVAAAAEELSARLKIVPPSSAIVVLPFVNLSADPENEYFCDGLSEELINGLTQSGDLRVVAHCSAFTFKGRDTDAREIGRKLNAGSVLEGSVRKAGNRLRISAQLIDAADGYHLWSEQFDRESDDIFAIQDEISLAILEKLKVQPIGQTRARSAIRPAASLEAYNLYLKGRSFWHRRYEGFLQKAMDCFQKAIDKDPGYAPAHVGLADCYNSLGVWAFADPGAVFPQARALTKKALDIDDTLSDAHASLGVVNIFYDWNWTAGESELRRAIELNPGNALVHLWYGHYLSIVGRMDESIAEVRLAQGLDPLSPTINSNVGYTLYLSRQYESAMVELNRTLELDPHFAGAHFYLGALHWHLGRYAEAIEEYKKSLELSGGALVWAAGGLGSAYAGAGDRRSARKVLREIDERRGYVPPSARALVYVGMGEDEKAYEWLDRALLEHDPLMSWIRPEPGFDRLRPDRRFQELLRCLGL